jgi:hypothetical protein
MRIGDVQAQGGLSCHLSTFVVVVVVVVFPSSNWNNTLSLSSEHLRVLGQLLDMVVLKRHEAE